MKIYIVGSIKINSNLRKKFFLHNLESLKTVSILFSWNFNIAGKYGEFCKKEILKTYKEAKITTDDQNSYYQIVKNQVSSVSENNSLLFFLQEDHWFVCPHKNLFLYSLSKFCNSKAEVLRIAHLTDFWEIESNYKLLSQDDLFKEYVIDFDSQKKVWEKNKDSRVTSLPGIFKKFFIDALLENNKDLLLKSKRSKDMELHSQKAVEFLQKRSIITLLPSFHILREVFLLSPDQRSIDKKRALKIIRARDKTDQKNIELRKIINLFFTPRILLGKIKRKIYGTKN